MPNLVVNSVSVFGFFIKVAIITVILFIASILSLQEMDELRERRYNSIFRREFSLLGKRLALTGNAWLRTQAVILFLTTCLCILTLIAKHILFHFDNPPVVSIRFKDKNFE